MSAAPEIKITAVPAAATVLTEEKTKQKKNKIASADSFDNDCQICCATFNKSTTKQIICPATSCAYSACVSCVRRYLMDHPLSPPHCMACKKPFNHLFLVDKLTKTWTIDKYKPHVSSIMVDVEISKLSESMEEAENRKKIAQLSSQFKDVKREKLLLQSKKKEVFDEKIKIFAEMRTKFREDPTIAEMKMTLEEKNRVETLREQHSFIRENIRCFWQKEHSIQDKIKQLKHTDTTKKTFTMPCSYNDCKGMLSTQYKCGLCEKYTCKDCQEPLQDEHKCNPDTVATTIAIKKETRPCPSCRTRIFKIEGCDQMWCTNCKTPFSWITGNAVPAGQRLHNPHAIEYLKKNGVSLRAPGDLVCGGIISRSQLTQIGLEIKNNMMPLFHSMTTANKNVNQVFVEHLAKFNVQPPITHPDINNCIFQVLIMNLMTVYTIVNEVSANKLRETRETAQTHHEFHEERVQFILNEIDKDNFAAKIKKYNTHKNIQLDMSFIWEIVSTFGIEMMTALYNARTCNNFDEAVRFFELLIQKLSEFSSLVTYANSQIAVVSVAHNCSVQVIDYSFDTSPLTYHSSNYFKTTKYSNATMRRAYGSLISSNSSSSS